MGSCSGDQAQKQSLKKQTMECEKLNAVEEDPRTIQSHCCHKTPSEHRFSSKCTLSPWGLVPDSVTHWQQLVRAGNAIFQALQCLTDSWRPRLVNIPCSWGSVQHTWKGTLSEAIVMATIRGRKMIDFNHMDFILKNTLQYIVFPT